jgi:hypothetical protein
MVAISVADPGCLSRILDPDFSHPGSQSQIQQEKRGVKKISCHTFFCSHKFHKIENYFIFGMLKKKIWASFQRMIELFIQKIGTKLSKIWVWDPGSEIQEKPIPDPASRGQKGTGSRILIRNTDRNGSEKRGIGARFFKIVSRISRSSDHDRIFTVYPPLHLLLSSSVHFPLCRQD